MIEADSIDEFKEIMKNPDALFESQFSSRKEKIDFWDTAIKIDGELEDYIHAIGGCSFQELQERINDIRDKADERRENS